MLPAENIAIAETHIETGATNSFMIRTDIYPEKN